LPGGSRINSDGRFVSAGNIGRWWTATETDAGYAYLREMGYNGDNVDEYHNGTRYGFSVRCVKDE